MKVKPQGSYLGFSQAFYLTATLFLKHGSLNFISFISAQPGSTAGLSGLMWALTLASEP